MESEQHHYELRSRSRSRSHTPLIHNRALFEMEQAEHHYDLRSKSRERSHTPGEATSSKRLGSRSMSRSASKVRDQNMQAIIENMGEPASEITTENQSKQSDSSASVVARKVERRSERQRAKRQIFANGQDETKEEINDSISEQVRKSVTPHRVLTSDYSSEEGEREDPPSRPGSAYEIYKQAGEWWNKFPKTDYTYSKKSQCRYEIAPGILAMPNMSRRPIHSDGSNNISNITSTNLDSSEQSLVTTESGLGDTLDSSDFQSTNNQNLVIMDSFTSNPSPKTTMFKKTHIQQYTMHREVVYKESKDSLNFEPRFSSFDKSPIDTTNYHRYDSDMELDEAIPTTSVKNTQKWMVMQQFQRFSTIIVAWFLKLLEFLKLRTSRKREYHNYHERTYYNESYWSKSWRLIMHYLQYIYFILAKVLLFDCWILSKFSVIRKRLLGPRTIWVPIIPLFLLAGHWGMSYVQEKVHQEYSTTDHNLNIIIDKLNERISKLEKEDSRQTEYLSNVTRILQNPRENESEIWQRFNVKITEIEKRLDNFKTESTDDVVTIKAEFQTLRELYSKLKSCSNTDKELFVPETLHIEIDKIIREYFGSTVSKKDLSAIVDKLRKSPMNTEGNIVPVNSDCLIKEDGILDEKIYKIVNDRIKIYDADKTGRVDYALESAGGEIISTRCTQTYDVKSGVFKLLGLTIYSESNNPRTVIQGNIKQPGICWPFQGFPGYLLIKLRSPVYIIGFTIEHAPKSILPGGGMKSAPRKFNVWGLTDQNDPEPVLFGDYEFADSDDNLQYFPIQNTNVVRPYEYIELRIHSNHGELEYTCLYRFRVHGKPL